jgi:hemerythrin-like domain-containing protein
MPADDSGVGPVFTVLPVAPDGAQRLAVMRAIQILCEEHDTLRKVLDALERMLDCQSSTDRIEADIALDALAWFERFADGLHQDREEQGLLPRLQQRAPERVQTVLTDMQCWHGRERERLEQMRSQIEGAAYGDPWSRDTFATAARAYIAIQRQHSGIEEVRLLPLAREVLTPEDDAWILAEYERLEQVALRAGEPTPAEHAQRIIRSASERVLECQPSLSPRRQPTRTAAAPPQEDVARRSRVGTPKVAPH